MHKKVLVMCTGNICRSPYGEYKLKSLLPELNVTSAGLAVDINRLVGKKADLVAVRIAAENGVNLHNHRARQITDEMIDEYDIILAMEQAQLDLLSEYFPNAEHKSDLFGKWLAEKDIKDPYKRGELAFRLVFNKIDDAAKAWVCKLTHSY